MMKKFLTLIPLILLFVTSLLAQEGCDIIVKLDSYHYDTLWFGHSLGKRAVPEFFALRQPDGSFELKSENPLPSGMYAIVFKRAANANFQFISCWLADGQRTFTFEADLLRLNTSANAIGSRENELLYRYLNRYYELTDKLDLLVDTWKEAWDEASFTARVEGEEELRRFQEEFIRENPGTLMAALVSQTLFLTPPAEHEKYENGEAEANARFQWQKQHYFDRMDLTENDFLRYPLWLDRVDYYVTKLPPPEPDSMIVLLEDVFNRLEPNEEGYKYYFRYMMNSLSRMSRYRTDEVFVHFVRKYVDTGKAGWMEEDDLSKYQSEAARMEPLFVGTQCPDVTLYDKESTPVSLYSFDAPYTLLVFWLYDCGHCKRELPIIEGLYEKYRSKGLMVMSVCGKSGDATPMCWEFAENMHMPSDWYILADPERRSRFSSLFDVRAYPRLILLDADKKILYKQTGEVPEATLEREFGKVLK